MMTADEVVAAKRILNATNWCNVQVPNYVGVWNPYSTDYYIVATPPGEPDSSRQHFQHVEHVVTAARATPAEFHRSNLDLETVIAENVCESS